MRECGDLVPRANHQKPVQPQAEKFPAFLLRQISCPCDASCPARGALRDRHERWDQDAVDASASSRASRARTNDVEADGEVVWFGRPDAGVKLAMMLPITPATVTTKPGRREEHEGNR
jgi:hypothetical protein